MNNPMNPMNMLSGMMGNKNPLAGMANNPIFQLVNILNSGGNPMAMIQQFAGQNPKARKAMKMMQGKNAQQLQEMAQNLAANQGVTVEDIARDLGIKL